MKLINLCFIAVLGLAVVQRPSNAQYMTPDDFMRETREADRFIKERRFDIAQRILLKLVATKHGGEHQYTQLAYCYLNNLPESQEYRAAENCALKAISIDPDCGSAYSALAEARLGQDNFTGAIDAATKGLSCKKPDEGSSYRRARAYAALNKNLEALKDFERYDRHVSTWNKSLVNFDAEGRLLVKMGRIDDAIQKFEADKKYHLEQATKNIINCLQNQKKYSEAVAEATTLIKHNPKDSDFFNLRGEAKAKAKDWKGAIADYSSAIELSPTETYYKNRAEVYKEVGQASLAKKDLSTAEKL